METTKELKELLVVNQRIAAKLYLTYKELTFQNEEHEKYSIGLICANKKMAEELEFAYKELAFQIEEKEKRIAELAIVNQELIKQNKEQEKRTEEISISNIKLQKSLQLNSDKDLFITILAHDLKSPFNGILGLSDLLVKNIQQYDLNKIEETVVLINESAQTTYNLLEDLFMWVKARSGNFPIKPQEARFATICKGIYELFYPIANAKNITISCAAVDQINVYVDIYMIQAVIRNLVSNAIKFTNNGGRVEIYSELSQTQITITVSDNGIGIESDILKKLFDISQVHSTIGTAGESGTGLGLVICKEFIEKHEGEIWAESEYGRGSKFKFTLPIK